MNEELMMLIIYQEGGGQHLVRPTRMADISKL